MAGATTTTTPSSVLTMKLLVDNSSPQRPHVVFAEAGKDTVDFLFSLLAMPAGSAARLLGKESVAGCVGNLYSSAEKLADSPYVHPGADKDAVLCAHMPSPAAVGPNSWLLRLPEPPAPLPPPRKKFFNCNYTYSYHACGNYMTEVSGTRCPSCGNQMVREMNITGLSPPQPEAAKKEGFVQGGMATYMVTDDLTISPVSNVSTIALLNACAVRDLGTLHERVVQIGYKEGSEILKASLQSKTVLTDVFLGRNSRPPATNNGRGKFTTSSSSRHADNDRPQRLRM